MTPLRAALLAALLFAAAPAPAARAQSANSLRELTRQSDVVVLSTCEKAESFWDDDGRVILTRSTLRIDKVFKGAAPSGEVVVETLGGTVGDVTMGASHAATLAPHETAVLFLRRSRHGGHHVIWGGTNGKLQVTEGPGGKPTVGRQGGIDIDAFATLLRGFEESP